MFDQVLAFLFYFNRLMEIDPDPRIGEWLAGLGIAPDPLTGISLAAGLYLATLLGGFAVLYSQMVLMNLMGQYIMYDLRNALSLLCTGEEIAVAGIRPRSVFLFSSASIAVSGTSEPVASSAAVRTQRT